MNCLFMKKLLFILLLPILTYSQQLAFPTAQGFGKNATGGRGGTVIKVTNLNDSGQGSFREALTTPGARIVVFEVGGTITLNSIIYVNHPNITIAGQTAPGDGILIKGKMVEFEQSNVIVRYVRFRAGQGSTVDSDCVATSSFSSSQKIEDIIFDHCSFSWGGDENFNIRGVNGGEVKNITLQNSIVSESTYNTLLYDNVYNISIYNNLYALTNERNIRANFPKTPINDRLDFEFINNMVYGFKVATKPSMGLKFTALNNYYKVSSQVTPRDDAVVDSSSSGGGDPSQTYAYVYGNIVPEGMDEYDTPLAPYIRTNEYYGSGIVAVEASTLPTTLLPHVGCSYPTRDEVDTRVIESWNAGNGVTATGDGAIYPTINGGTALIDTNGNGIPDTWETANMGGADANDLAPSGYTWIEEFINQIRSNDSTLSIPKITLQNKFPIGYKYQIYNIIGQLVIEGKIEADTLSKLKEELEGLYILKMENGIIWKTIF